VGPGSATCRHDVGEVPTGQTLHDECRTAIAAILPPCTALIVTLLGYTELCQSAQSFWTLSFNTWAVPSLINNTSGKCSSGLGHCPPHDPAYLHVSHLLVRSSPSLLPLQIHCTSAQRPFVYAHPDAPPLCPSTCVQFIRLGGLGRDVPSSCLRQSSRRMRSSTSDT